MAVEEIGLIGIGLLGTSLAARLRGAGFGVGGYDQDPAAMGRLRELGGRALASAAEVTTSCRRIVLSLPGPADVEGTVVLMEPVLTAGAIILDTTTGDPTSVEALARRLADRGVTFLDATIGGSSRQVAAGEAIVVCGGAGAAFEACHDILSCFGRAAFHTGAAGTGTRMKLVMNLALGLHRAVLAESLEFARRNGIDPAEALEILRRGPSYSRVMDTKGDKMLRRDFAPEARLAQHLKDVRLILQTGAAAGARLPLSEVHQTLLEEAVEMGHGDDDNSAVIQVFAREKA